MLVLEWNIELQKTRDLQSYEEGTVIYVDANKIEIKYDLDANEKLFHLMRIKTYSLIKFRRTNQDTCINLCQVKLGESQERSSNM